ncbi:MAG: TerB family tellurite resistance protein [Alphaproteobacteria bacterium]
MLDRIIAYLDARMEQGAINPDPFERAHVAVAALLVEASRMDGHYEAFEQGTIVRIIRETLKLPPQKARELLALAEIRQAGTWHDWIFCQAIKRGFDRAERIDVLEKLWEIAMSDGQLHNLESMMLNRVAEELEIPLAERERIALKAKAAAG